MQAPKILCPLGLFIFAAVAPACQVAAPAAAYGQASQATDLITVTGECFREVLPDRAQLSIGAEIREKERSIASSKATELYSAALKATRALNLSDAAFETIALNVQEWVEYDSHGKVERKGWVAQAMFTVATSDTTRVGEVIQLAEKLGLQNIQGPNVYASPQLRRSTYQGCLEDAVQNARTKADKIAKAAGGSTAGALWSAQESGGLESMQAERDFGQARAKAAEGGAPIVELRPIPVRVNVAVNFKSRP